MQKSAITFAWKADAPFLIKKIFYFSPLQISFFAADPQREACLLHRDWEGGGVRVAAGSIAREGRRVSLARQQQEEGGWRKRGRPAPKEEEENIFWYGRRRRRSLICIFQSPPLASGERPKRLGWIQGGERGRKGAAWPVREEDEEERGGGYISSVWADRLQHHQKKASLSCRTKAVSAGRNKKEEEQGKGWWTFASREKEGEEQEEWKRVRKG